MSSQKYSPQHHSSSLTGLFSTSIETRQKDRIAAGKVEHLKGKKKNKKREEGANLKKNSFKACWVMVYDKITWDVTFHRTD